MLVRPAVVGERAGQECLQVTEVCPQRVGGLQSSRCERWGA